VAGSGYAHARVHANLGHQRSAIRAASDSLGSALGPGKRILRDGAGRGNASDLPGTRLSEPQGAVWAGRDSDRQGRALNNRELAGARQQATLFQFIQARPASIQRPFRVVSVETLPPAAKPFTHAEGPPEEDRCKGPPIVRAMARQCVASAHWAVSSRPSTCRVGCFEAGDWSQRTNNMVHLLCEKAARRHHAREFTWRCDAVGAFAKYPRWN